MRSGGHYCYSRVAEPMSTAARLCPWPDDEDIPSNDTTMPTTQQGPMTRARAQELNYQVNSFLPVPKPSSQNWMLLNHCDDFIVIRNDGEEANGSTNQFGHQDCTTRKHKIGHQVQTSSSYSRATSN